MNVPISCVVAMCVKPEVTNQHCPSSHTLMTYDMGSTILENHCTLRLTIGCLNTNYILYQQLRLGISVMSEPPPEPLVSFVFGRDC